MIEILKNDDVITKVGGRFKLTALIQRRWVELMQGARPTVDPTGKTAIEVIVEEILEGHIGIDYEKSGLEPPESETTDAK